jgi:integrase
MARAAKYACSCLNPAASRRSFGALRILPSGRHQARYFGPDAVSYAAPMTFETHGDADAFLAATRTDIVRGTWVSPSAPAPRPALTFGEYTTEWLRQRPLKPTTRSHYEKIVDRILVPAFGSVELTTIDPAMVKQWWAALPTNVPAMNTASYRLLRTILNGAIEESIIAINPAKLKGAGQSNAKIDPKICTPAQLETITAAMPDRLKLAVQLAYWAGPRFGELFALTRDDIDVRNHAINIRRGVTRTKGEIHVGTPKSAAGKRVVHYNPELAEMVKVHLRDHVKWGADALLFPAANGGFMGESLLYYYFRPARILAGRPDLRWHDFRHSSATVFGESGATVPELLTRFGWSDPAIAMRYCHASSVRDKALAAKMASGS